VIAALIDHFGAKIDRQAAVDALPAVIAALIDHFGEPHLGIFVIEVGPQ
jgi:hypothetical protein